MKKKLLIPVLTLTVLAGTLYGVGNVFAETAWSDNTPIVQRLVERFGLDENEVREVFSEIHDEQQMDRQIRFEENLEDAFTNGEITAEQRQAILEKHAEIMDQQQSRNKEDFPNMTHEERQAFYEARRAEMDSWAEENGIDLKYFLGKGHSGFREGHMGQFEGRGK